eukprot:4940222-Alexandrium_andersonii.AAC.1
MQHFLPAFTAVQAAPARRVLAEAGHRRPAQPHIVASDFIRLPRPALVKASASVLGARAAER